MRYNEFSVKAIWPKIKGCSELLEYLPSDDMKKGKYPNREFVWGVIHTVKPEWATQYTKLALEERYK